MFFVHSGIRSISELQAAQCRFFDVGQTLRKSSLFITAPDSGHYMAAHEELSKRANRVPYQIARGRLNSASSKYLSFAGIASNRTDTWVGRKTNTREWQLS